MFMLVVFGCLLLSSSSGGGMVDMVVVEMVNVFLFGFGMVIGVLIS